ncbi:MAG: hypothetical protein JRN08_07335 [Nitrososphaerota archaeon]|nr:hypothetical protein [Nitrososphaerota archaeon]
MNARRAAVPVATTVALLAIDYQLASALARFDIFSQATTLELVIVALQFAKTVAAFGIRDLREASPGVLVDYYGAELLALPVLAVGFFFTHSPSYLAVLDQLVDGWMTGAAFATIPFAAYKIGTTMYRSGELSSVVPAGIVTTELGLLFANAANTAADEHLGLGGIIVAAFVRHGGETTLSPWLFAVVATVFVSLLVYSAYSWARPPGIAFRPALVIAIAATLGCAGWIVAFSALTTVLSFMLLPPVFAIVAVCWWMGRGR